MTSKKEDILRLRAEGKTYNEIRELTGASKGTISYHCGQGTKQKNNERLRSWRKDSKTRNQLLSKISSFKYSRSKSGRDLSNSPNFDERVKRKIYDFQAQGEGIERWGMKEFLQKFDGVTECYLTGQLIDINDPDTFALDHIIPRSAGGSNSIENVGLVTPHANYAKHDMDLESFVQMCFQVVDHWSQEDDML